MTYEEFNTKWPDGKKISISPIETTEEYQSLHNDIKSYIETCIESLEGCMCKDNCWRCTSSFILNIHGRFMYVLYNPPVREIVTHSSWIIGAMKDEHDCSIRLENGTSAKELAKSIKHEFDYFPFK